MKASDGESNKLFTFDNKIYKRGFKWVAGVDESGRGPLAGPLVSAAVILPRNTRIDGLKDCKQLSPLKREDYYLKILEQAVSYCIKTYDNHIIDKDGVHKTNLTALEQAYLGLSVKPDFILIDGYRLQNLAIPNLRIIKGDQVSACVAAASILAKVHRDRIMKAFHHQYPEYDFASHKGYGSKRHFAAIDRHGLTPIHRRSFLKAYTKSQ